MKRIVSLILVFIILLSVCTVVWAVDIDRVSVTKSMEFLQMLEIVQKEYDSNNLNLEQKITRAEFAGYLQRLLNISLANSGTLYYNDVPKTYYAFNEITALTEQGYLSGTSAKKFEPDAIIEKEHAYIVILKALGYGAYLELDMNNLDTVLRKSKINKNVSDSNELLFGDLIIMMKNALLANRLEMKGINSNGGVYIEGKTLLYETRRMEYVMGERMTAANGASIYGESVNTESVVIEEREYITSLGNIMDYLGRKVNYVYYEPYEDAKCEIVWIEKSKVLDELNIMVDEYSKYDKATSTLYYFEDGTSYRKSITIPREISVIYNGVFTTENISEIFSQNRYELSLIKTDGSTYDTAIVWAYENHFVNDIDAKSLMLYDSLTKTELSLNEGDYNYFKITTRDGKKLSPEEIEKKSILSTYISKDKSFFRAVVSTETVSGVYGGYDSETGINIDDKSYRFYEQSDKRDYKGAKRLTLYLDCKGYIAHAEASYTSENMLVGYVYKVSCAQDGFSPTIYLKVFGEDGVTYGFSITDSVNVDGVKYNNIEKAYEKFAKDANGNVKPQLMCFTRNSDGRITRIDLSDDNGGSGNVIMQNKVQPAGGIVHFKDTMNIIGMNMLVNSGTKIFYVPTDYEISEADDSDFAISTPVDAQSFNSAVSYKITPDEVFYEQYIVRKGELTETQYSDYEGFFVVDSVIKKLNDKGDVVDAIVGMRMGEKLTLEIDPKVFDLFAVKELQGLKSGDIIRIAHKDNVLGNARLIYSFGQMEPVAENRDNPVHTARFISGYVHSKEGNVFKLDFEGDGTWEQIVDMTNYLSNIIVYDSQSRGDKAYKGTVADMKAATEAGKGSFVVLHTYYMRCWGAVIYK